LGESLKTVERKASPENLGEVWRRFPSPDTVIMIGEGNFALRREPMGGDEGWVVGFMRAQKPRK